MSDLHYWRGTRVACLTTLCEMLTEGKLLKNKGFKDDISDHLCIVVFRLNSFGRGSLIPVIGLSL